jgi:hypothetical protein
MIIETLMISRHGESLKGSLRLVPNMASQGPLMWRHSTIMRPDTLGLDLCLVAAISRFVPSIEGVASCERNTRRRPLGEQRTNNGPRRYRCSMPFASESLTGRHPASAPVPSHFYGCELVVDLSFLFLILPVLPLSITAATSWHLRCVPIAWDPSRPVLRYRRSLALCPSRLAVHLPSRSCTLSCSFSQAARGHCASRPACRPRTATAQRRRSR